MDEGNPSSDPAWSGTRGGSGPLSASSAEVPDGWRPLDDAASDADQVGAADRKPRQGISPFRAAGVLVLPLPPAGPAHGDVSSGPRYSPANKGGMTISTLPAARLRLQPHLPRVLRQIRHVRHRLGLRHDVADAVNHEEQLALLQPVDGVRRPVEALDRGEDLQLWL